MTKDELIDIPKDEKSAEEIAAAINELIGLEKGIIPDKAYTSVSLSENLNYFTHYPIKVVTRHILEPYMEMSEDIRHTKGMKELYQKRKQTIERIF